VAPCSNLTPQAHKFNLKPLQSLPTLLATLALLFNGPLRAQTTAAAESLPTSGILNYESLRLPDGERLGLAGGSLLFDIGNDWGLGPAVYAAVRGQRGGFFVGGVELQRRWALARGLSVATGLYLGGGGGAAAPVGGGLMVRPAITLLKDLGPSLQVGISWSSVRFPSGQISSNQIGLALAWRNEFIHLKGAEGGPVPSLNQTTGLGFERMQATVSRYRLSGNDTRQIGLVGARAERRTNVEGLTWGLEAAAAAQGGSAGYMEFLGTAALSVAPLSRLAPSWRVGVRASAGPAGGGAVPTGGGLIGKGLVTTELRVAPGWALGAEYGAIRSLSGGLRAREARVWLGIDLEPGAEGRNDLPGRLVRTEWVGALQHHARIARRDGAREPLETIGLKLNRYVLPNVYLSGQAHSAFAGGAGAYSVGLVGAGIATRADTPWRLGAEALIGAAGGGGVATSGGALAQSLLWGSWNTANAGEWRAGIGTTRVLRGGSTSPLVELSWSRAFGSAGR
jgi:hypothetical protein